MRLSKNFTLEEFLVSQTAARHGIDMTPPDKVVRNLKRLVTTCLQPLRDELDAPIFISSGYRPVQLNHLIGGSVTSAHILGEAADFRVLGITPLQTCQVIVTMGLPYDQVIHEFGAWTHLGIAKRPRREQLTASKHDGRTVYDWGLHEVERPEVAHA